jgi:L-xylulokinase
MGAATPFDSEVVFLPCLFGGFSDGGTRGAFLNLSGYNNRDHLLQAVFEGVAFSTMLNVKRLARSFSDFRAARLGGGVANSPVWSQMMADVLQMPMETLRGRELSARGAAMGAGVACGEFSGLEEAVRRMVHVGRVYAPRPEFADVYARKFARFKRAVNALDAFHADVSRVESGSL